MRPGGAGRESQRSIMPGTRTIWRVGFAAATARLLLLGSLGLTLGCDFGSERRKRHAPTRPEERASVASSASSASSFGNPEERGLDAAAPVPSVIAQTLRAVREKLDIAPPQVPLQRLAFGAGRLAQARDSSVAFLETKHGEQIAEASIDAVRAVANGVDGSLFALGVSAGVRLEAHASKPLTFPHAAFFPGSLLFPDLEEPRFFYVFYSGEDQLYRYAFEVDGGAFLPIVAQSPLEGCTGALAPLRDGVFVCRTASGFARKAPRGRRVEFKAAAGLPEPFRLLPAKRFDELFAVSRLGEVVRVRLAPGVPELGRFRLPSAPYAAAGNGEVLAFVLVSAPEPGQPRRWSLLVTDLEGQPRFRAELSAMSAPAGDRWLEEVVEDKNLAISSFGPLVGVGGSLHVAVWDYVQAQPVFHR